MIRSLCMVLPIAACAAPHYWEAPLDCSRLASLTKGIEQRDTFATAEIAGATGGLVTILVWPATTPYVIGGFIGLNIADIVAGYALPSVSAMREERSYLAARCAQ